jgi:hypothetical protein
VFSCLKHKSPLTSSSSSSVRSFFSLVFQVIRVVDLRLRQTRQNLVDSKALIHIRKCFYFFTFTFIFLLSFVCVVNELLEKCFEKTHRPAESRVSLLRRRLLSQVTFPPRGIFDMLWTRSQKRSNCHSVCVCVCAVGFALWFLFKALFAAALLYSLNIRQPEREREREPWRHL